jgi:hypothetical protein
LLTPTGRPIVALLITCLLLMPSSAMASAPRTVSAPSPTTPGTLPMPLISRNVPAFSPNAVYPAGNANNADYSDYWQAPAPTWLTYDLSSVPVSQRKQVLVVWYNDTTGAYDFTVIGSGAYGVPSTYTLDVNAAPGGTAPPTSGWVTKLSVTNNNYHSRQHLIDLTGYSWLRFAVSSVNASTTDAAVNLDVYDASAGGSDDWIFYGDSITQGAMNHSEPNTYMQQVNAVFPGNFPVQENGGIGYLYSSDGASHINTWLNIFPGNFVSLAYGTNDALGGTAPSTFYNHYVTMVNAVVSAGKSPIVPKIPWGCSQKILANGPALNAEIDTLYANFPQVIRGPDFWTFFNNNPSLISSDCVHPTRPTGMQAYRQQYGQLMINTVYTATVPGAPTNVVASGGNGSAVVSWTAPGNGGSPITGYAVSSTPAGGSATVSGSSTSATVSGLSNGTSYTFTVTASNAVGTGPASAPSNAVIPGVPVVVTGVSPSSGPAAGGTVVTITGSGFTGATAVKFGSVAASSFTVSSDTQITATSPAAAPGSVDVTVVVAGRSNPLGPGDRFSYGNLLDVVSTKQYHLSGSDGQSWTDVDGSALSLVIVPTVNEQVVLSGNADLWTATAGVNQDLGIDVNGSLVAWKESGGFAGTFSPNAAYVQTVVTMNAGSSNVVKLRWKSNKATPGSIYAGAGPIGGQYSPTRLTAKLIPVTNGTESHAVSHAQGSLSGNDGSSWVDLDGGAVSTSFIPASAGMALLGGNADLFTGTTGINQDLGIWLSGGTYGSGRVVAWKESGGFAGTFSPNAAFVQTAQPVLAGVTYTVKLQWKANRPENGGTIYAGAGAAAPYSPTGVTVQLLPASALLVASITNQDRLTGSLSDGAQWVPIDPGMPVLSLTPSSNCLALLSGNADLWTATGGYNQDLALSVNGTTIGWKESGGFAGTASPNAAFVQTVLPMNAATTYWMGLRWKANRPAQTATIYAGAGSGLNISPTSLIVELAC